MGEGRLRVACPSLLSDKDPKDVGIELVYSEETNILYWTDFRAAKAGQKSPVRGHDKPNEPTKEGPLSFLYSLIPHLPQFQQPAGATPL